MIYHEYSAFHKRTNNSFHASIVLYDLILNMLVHLLLWIIGMHFTLMANNIFFSNSVQRQLLQVGLVVLFHFLIQYIFLYHFSNIIFQLFVHNPPFSCAIFCNTPSKGGSSCWNPPLYSFGSLLSIETKISTYHLWMTSLCKHALEYWAIFWTCDGICQKNRRNMQFSSFFFS